MCDLATEAVGQDESAELTELTELVEERWPLDDLRVDLQPSQQYGF